MDNFCVFWCVLSKFSLCGWFKRSFDQELALVSRGTWEWLTHVWMVIELNVKSKYAWIIQICNKHIYIYMCMYMYVVNCLVESSWNLFTHLWLLKLHVTRLLLFLQLELSTPHLESYTVPARSPFWHYSSSTTPQGWHGCSIWTSKDLVNKKHLKFVPAAPSEKYNYTLYRMVATMTFQLQ